MTKSSSARASRLVGAWRLVPDAPRPNVISRIAGNRFELYRAGRHVETESGRFEWQDGSRTRAWLGAQMGGGHPVPLLIRDALLSITAVKGNSPTQFVRLGGRDGAAKAELARGPWATWTGGGVILTK